jgi:hypothetical protein
LKIDVRPLGSLIISGSFLIILGLILSSETLAQGYITDDTCKSTPNVSILDMASQFRQIGSHSGIFLKWPLIFLIIHNNPPTAPITPLGITSGTPGANYVYRTHAIDPDGDRVQYTFDWGDGNTSSIGLIDSGAMISTNHSWNKAGVYRVSAKANDDKGASSEWSDPLYVTIDTPPRNPSAPSGQRFGRPGISYAYSVLSNDPDGDQIRYAFDWGDGTTSTTALAGSGTKATAYHSWNRSETYRIRANATDSFGRTSGWSEPLTVTLNSPPDSPSTPSGPDLGRPGTLYIYNVSASDPDGDQISYALDWGDGTDSIIGPVASGKAAEAGHSWDNAGDYPVRAYATDSKGERSGWSISRTVIINAPPAKPSTPLGPLLAYAWASNNYSAFVIDPNRDPVRCTFDWGDGNASTTNFIKSSSNANASHIWIYPGTYQIKAMATDRIGDASLWSDLLTVTVIANNRPEAPMNIFGPNSGYVEIAHSYFTLAKDIDSDQVRYTFDWGDGSTSETDPVDSGSVERSSHAWTNAGTYRIKCITTDSRNVSSEWSRPFNVSIIDNNPPAIPMVPSGPTAGQSSTVYNYATSSADPNGDRVRYVFDWGDGTTSWTGLGFIRSGTEERVSHKWVKAGEYKVKAMAMDDKGAFSGWSNALDVNIS